MNVSRLRFQRLFVVLFLCIGLLLVDFASTYGQSTDDPLKPQPTVDAAAEDADAALSTWSSMPDEARAKVDPRLLAEFRGEIAPTHLSRLPEINSGALPEQTRFLVILQEQADVEILAQRVYASAAEQRLAVVDELSQVAQRAQAPVRTLLNTRRQLGAVTGYQPFTVVNAIAVEGDLATVSLLAQRDDVARIVANYPLVRTWEPSLPVADAEAIERQVTSYPWNIAFSQVNRVWQEFGVRGEGAVVGGFDTGVAFQHPALVGAYRGTETPSVFEHNYNWFEPDGRLYPDGDLGPSVSLEPYDCDYTTHGTHTMGTMIGDGGSDELAIGMAPAAQWIAVPGICANTMSGAGISDDIGGLKAFQWFLCPTDLSGDMSSADCAKAPDVINNSWGSTNPVDTVFQPALQALRAAGTAVVFAAGNTGRPGSIGAPGHLPEAITVGAVDSASSLAYFSSQGPAFHDLELKPNLTAPGVSVLSSVGDRWYDAGSGTSMAAPHVAGLIALLVSADLQDGFRDFTVDEIERFIYATVVDAGENGPDYLFGEGIMNAFAAVRWLLSAGEVTGVVRDADNAPIAGVIIDGVNTVTGDVFTYVTDGEGIFSLSAPAGHYTLTLRHPFFERATLSGQRVIAGALTTINMHLTPRPLATLSGVVRNEDEVVFGAKVHLVSDVPIEGTTAADGSFRFNVPPGEYKLVVEARGHRHLERAVTVPASGENVDIVLTAAPSILLVNADASAGWFYGWPVHHFVGWALTAHDYLYDLWEIQYTSFVDQREMVDGTVYFGVPSLDTLRAYDVVIWVHSGCSYYCTTGTPNAVNADAVLAAYLDGGGRLLISGQDVGRADNDGAFYDRYLKADLLNDFGGYEGSPLEGADFLQGLSLQITNASFYGESNSAAGLSPDVVAGSGGAFPILRYTYLDEPAALAVAPCGQDYRAIYLAMGYENVAPRAEYTDSSADDMSALLARSVEWLAGADSVEYFHINSMVSQRTGDPGTRQNYAILLENSGATPLTLSLSLSPTVWPVSLEARDTQNSASLVVAGCSAVELLLSVQIPRDAEMNATETVTLTVSAPGSSIPEQSKAFTTRMFPQWQQAAPLATGRRVALAATVPTLPKVFVIGGLGESGALTDVDQYDPCADAWTSLSPLPTPLMYSGAATIGRRIYVVGGTGAFDSNVTDKLWIYDVDRDAWEEGPAMPVRLMPSAVAAWRDRLYVFGGVNEETYINNLLYFDATTSQWVVVGELPFYANPFSIVAATWQDAIYVLETYATVNATHVFNPLDNSWRTASPHGQVVDSASLVAEGGYLYLLGGQLLAGDGAMRYDPVQDAWTPFPMPRESQRANAGVAALKDRLVVIGGGLSPSTTEVLSLRRNLCDSSVGARQPTFGIGESFDLDIVLESGATVVENGRFVAPLPATVTFEGFVENPIGALYNPVSHSIEWQGTLLAGTLTTIRFTIRTPADMPAETWLEGEVTFGGGEYHFTRSWRVLVQAADFSLSTKEASAPTIIEGERLTYTVEIRGRTPIGGALSLQDTLPSVLALVPDSLSATIGELLFEPLKNMVTWRSFLPHDDDTTFNATDNYLWGDSNGDGAVSSVVYVWEEIADTGRFLLKGDDQSQCQVPIGFGFPFYDQKLTELCVSTNGYVVLGSESGEGYVSCPFPTNAPYGIIAGHAEDLVVDGGIYAQTVGNAPNRRLILQWKNARRFGYDSQPTIDFQIVLWESGNVDVRILRTPVSRTSNAKVGIQSVSADQGVTYSCGTPALHQNLAIQFLAPGQSDSKPAGRIQYAVELTPGVSANAMLTNTALLQTPAGPFSTSAVVQANPLSLATSSAWASQSEVLVNQPFAYKFEVHNSGLVTATQAELYNLLPPQLDYVADTLTCSADACAVSGDSVRWQGTVAPGGSVTIAYSATVTIDTPDLSIITNTAQIDDGFGGTTEIATSIRARQADLAASFVEVDPPIVRPGDLVTYTLYLHNAGGEDVALDAYHQLPVGMAYVADSLWCGVGVCEMQGDIIHWQGALARRVVVPVRIQARLSSELAEGARLSGVLEFRRQDRPEPYLLPTQILLAQRYFLSEVMQSGSIWQPGRRIHLPVISNFDLSPMPTPTPSPFNR